jgi:hypothetical protein
MHLDGTKDEHSSGFHSSCQLEIAIYHSINLPFDAEVAKNFLHGLYPSSIYSWFLKPLYVLHS